MRTARLLPAVLACGPAAAPLAQTRQTLLMNRLGPSQVTLSVANADGSSERPLLPSSAFDYHASFSPDGRLLAFVSTRGTEVANVWVLDLKTPQARNVTGGRTLPAPEAGVTTGSPKSSPDGRRIVFYEVPTELTFAARIQEAQARVTSQIVSVDVASGARTVYASGPGLTVSPQFLSADRIGYRVKAAPQPAQTGLASTTGAAAVGGSFRSPAWSSGRNGFTDESAWEDSMPGLVP